MRRISRISLVVASAGTAAAIALTGAGAVQAANVALMVNGIAGGTGLPDLVMANVLGGMFGDYQRQNISWPQQARPVTGPNSLLLGESIDQGVANLDAALESALAQLGPGEHVTLVGLSAGALVVDEAIRRISAEPNAPDKSVLNVVVAGDSSRMLFNTNRYDAILRYRYTPPVETKYDTTVVTAQYDGFADFPDRPANVVAIANAIAGMVIEHVPHMLTGLSTVPASNITVTTNSMGGVTTSYLAPATHLPLVKLIPALAPQEARLKKIVDAAYRRNDVTSTAAAPTAAAVAAGAASHPMASVARRAQTPKSPRLSRAAARQA